MEESTPTVVSFIEQISQAYGSGNWALDFAFVMLGVSLTALVLVLFLLPRSKGAAVSAEPQGLSDRTLVMGGRLEKLERALNETRTEVLRSVAAARAENEELRRELDEVRDKLGLAAVRKPDAAEPEPFAVAEEPEGEAFETAGGLALQAEPAQLLEPEAELPGGEAVPAAEAAEPESLSKRLKKSRVGLFEKIRSVFAGKPKLDEAMVEELEALLVGSDLGVKTVHDLIAEVRSELQRGDTVGETQLTDTLKGKVLALLEKDAPLNPVIRPEKRGDGPLVVMMVGVNGVGKTTTTAKLASMWHESGAKVLMVAADTFRAAAVEQLVTWGQRIGVPVVAGAPEAKPQTVVFDALARAKAEGFDVVIIDTAGRLHTKSNLMQELEGVRHIAERHHAGAPHETVLVVDGTTGQNAIAQAREFNAAVPLTGLIVTKLDGTPKGGVVVAIKNELGIPVRYIGVGESAYDLRPFIPRDFVEALFDTSDLGGASPEAASAHGEVRRRRRRDTQGYD